MNITVTPKFNSPQAAPLRFEKKAEAPQTQAKAPSDSFVPSERQDAPKPAQPGDKREFWTWDMSVMPPGEKKVSTTCRSVGGNTNIWVDDAVWERLVTAEDVFTLQKRLEEKSPTGSVDPRKGIVAINEEYFGKAPVGMDGDPKVNILLTEFASFRGTVMDGYFNAFDTLTDKEAQEEYGQRSNETEVVYMNAASRRISSDYMQGVLAHEYQHLLHFPHDGEEESWLSETLGEVAMKVNGYHTDMGHVARHQSRPHLPLVSQTYVDYGACMLFGSYMTEQFGEGFIQELSQDPRHGVESINGTLSELGVEKSFDSIYRDWVVANYADSKGVATPGNHYASLNVPAPAQTVVEGSEFNESNTLRPTGARYYKLPEADVELSVTSPSEQLTTEILEFDGKKMTRRAYQPGMKLQAHPDRVLVVGSLAAEDVEYSVELKGNRL